MQSVQREIDEITNTLGERLRGILHPAGSGDLVIVTHGFASSKEEEMFADICKSFQSKGINAFRFDFSGCGISEGRPEDSCYSKQADDLGSVISYFSDKGYCVRSVVSHSAGATATIMRAAKDRRMGSVILIAPRIELSNSIIVKAIKAAGKTISDIIEAPDTVYPYAVEIEGRRAKRVCFFSKDYLKELRDADILGAIRQIRVPAVILLGTEDRKVSDEEVRHACKANAGLAVVHVEAAGHTFRKEEQRAKLIAEMMKWYEYTFEHQRDSDCPVT